MNKDPNYNPDLKYPEEYYEDIPAEEFVYVQEDEALSDEAFKTKPIGFFKDALIRLRKNKASVGAFWIIVFIIFMAIFGPNFNKYTYREQLKVNDEYLSNMPPRVSWLKWIPLFNGQRVLKNKQVKFLDDPEKYPNDCVVEVINRREEGKGKRKTEMCDVVVDYYRYLGLDDDTNFWFGTDNIGRDVWTRVWRGTRVSLIIAAFAVITDIVIGVVYGAVCGYYGGAIDLVLMRICEVIRSIPNVVVCTMFILMLGTGIKTMIIAMAIRNWVGTARLMRTQFLRFKNREYVMAARTMGVRDRALIFRHILPNSVGPLITSAMVAIPSAIFTESFLSYIGLGIPAPEPSIGTMLSEAQAVLEMYPYQTLFPAVIVSLLMIAFNLFSNGLRDAFDPTQRGAE